MKCQVLTIRGKFEKKFEINGRKIRRKFKRNYLEIVEKFEKNKYEIKVNCIKIQLGETE